MKFPKCVNGCVGVSGQKSFFWEIVSRIFKRGVHVRSGLLTD